MSSSRTVAAAERGGNGRSNNTAACREEGMIGQNGDLGNWAGFLQIEGENAKTNAAL